MKPNQNLGSRQAISNWATVDTWGEGIRNECNAGFTTMTPAIKTVVVRCVFHALLGGVVAVCVALMMSNTYLCQGTILPSSAKGGGVGSSIAALAAASLGGSGGGLDVEMSVLENILNSKWMANSLLQDQYDFETRFGYFGRRVRHQSTLMEYFAAKNLDAGAASLKGVFKVKNNIKAGLLTVSADTNSAQLSQELVRKSIDFLELYLRTKNQSKGRFKAEFASQRLVEKKSEALAAEERFIEFSNRNRNYLQSADSETRVVGMRLESDLTFARSLVLNAAQAYESALLESKDSLQTVNVLDRGDLPEQKSGPKRSRIVLVVMILVGLSSWAYQMRDWLTQKLIVE